MLQNHPKPVAFEDTPLSFTHLQVSWGAIVVGWTQRQAVSWVQVGSMCLLSFSDESGMFFSRQKAGAQEGEPNHASTHFKPQLSSSLLICH